MRIAIRYAIDLAFLSAVAWLAEPRGTAFVWGSVAVAVIYSCWVFADGMYGD